ncbi:MULTISPECIES: hypothetical protein [Halorussus]|uniref:phage terminase large subunit family protein n=1 Tax=Halorussus TaxID=1070314 RepID=UPI00209C9A55|nr:hypothetical protein [Halorussus vallis]USZ75653.1 hypothetical protein NGM07_19770 [Halorussus vallis]USZ75707.1 hypothetical protein NGM07_20045 [Halorussus vallis]
MSIDPNSALAELDPDQQAEQIWRDLEEPERRREVLNPFEDCPWEEFLNELTYGYMQGERDDWIPVADVHLDWVERFRSDKDVGLLAHRDSLKTTATLGIVIAHLEYIDGFRAHWITNTQGQAHKKADTEFWKLVERNSWLTNLNSQPVQDTKEVKEFQNGSVLHAGWLFGAIEGDRSHLLILDDLIKEHGDGETDNVLTWIEGVTVPMVKDSGKTAIIGTRKRPDDIYSHIADREAYDFTEYPAILDVWDQEFGDDDNWEERRPPEDLYTEVDNPLSEGGDTVRVLWPEARGPQYLADKYAQMSPHLFWREFCMVIMGASGNLIEKTDVDQLVDDGGCSIRNQVPPIKMTPGAGEATVVAHDPAQSSTGDNAAFVVFHVGRDGRRRLLDAHAETGMKPSAIRAKLLDLDDRYDPAMVVIESNGMQQYVANDAIEFSASLRSKVTGIPTTGKKHSWENGIPRLRTLVGNGGIQFYRGHGPTEDFIQAALSLKLKDGKLSGHTPDLIAAWYMAEQGIRRLEGMGALAGDDDDTSGISYL